MSDENLVGQTIAGKYRVEKILGKGGMGLVVGAHHLGLNEPVAIKLLRPAMMEVSGMVARFEREARAASKIKSEHVVRVTDVDRRDDGLPYMVMEYLTGNDFSEVVKEKGRLGVAEAVGFVLEACEAIAEAHELGIVHRDLKPSNLFLHTRRDGRRVVKVLDFGISKIDVPGEQDATKTGQMMGSPKYMSPEQMLSMHDVDARTDVWSLGAILFDLICGRPPFDADTTPRICALVLNADPPLPSSMRPDVPVEVEQIILRCLDKDVDRRIPDVKTLVGALAPFRAVAAEFEAGLARPTSSETSLRTAKATPTATPTAHGAPAPPPSATVAAWDATRYDGPPIKPAAGRARIAIAALAVLVLGGVGSLYALGGRSAPASQHLAAPTASASESAPRPMEKPAVSPHDLPDVEPTATATARASAPPQGSGAPSKKPKPKDDPFGGRRN